MFKWYEIGKLTWDEIMEFINKELLKQGVSLPEQFVQCPEEPTFNDKKGQYFFSVGSFCFDNEEVAVEYYSYIHDLIQNKEMFDYQGGLIKSDFYNVRLDKKFIEFEISEDKKIRQNIRNICWIKIYTMTLYLHIIRYIVSMKN